jgi:hypothetical protein
MPPVSAVGTLPLAARRTDPQARTAAFDARLLTFHARAADQAHAAFTPGTTWPVIGTPARLITGEQPNPRFRCQLNCANDASTAHTHPENLGLDAFWNVFLVPT